MDKTERRIIIYSSLLITLLINSPKLLALRENGVVAQYWHFNLAELLFQIIFNFCACYLLFYFNLTEGKFFSEYRNQKKYITYFFINVLFLLTFCLIGGAIQHYAFNNVQLKTIFWTGYLTRYFLSGLFTGILVKIILLLRESKLKGNENERLKTAYLEAELELLKEQLNPHFLFNSLSTLSGVIREDPARAQNFISHLSKIFRYALTRSGSHLVTLAEELTMIKSYELLLKIRFEEAFYLKININPKYHQYKLPHLSLQPLLENAAKHNSASVAKPLTVSIFIDDDKLVVSNNLQQIAEAENSTGIGLVNLNSRFKILMHHEIEIIKDHNHFTIKLPFRA